MSRARAKHPTDRPNYSIFYFDGVGFAFSYETLVGLQLPDSYHWRVHQNDWSVTTGKHLNDLNSDHSTRLTSEEFEAVEQSIPRLVWPERREPELTVEKIRNQDHYVR